MKRRIEVNDILMEFLGDYETSGDEALLTYVEKYPEMAETFQRRAGILRMFETLPETELSAEQEETLNLRAASVVQNLIFEMKREPDAASDPTAQDEQSSFTSLRERLTAIGETFESAAAKLRLSDLILEKLDKRRIRPESVPRLLYERLAELLTTTFDDIYGYSLGTPVLGTGHYKASSTPTVVQQPEFSELVKWDSDMNEADKEYWLSMPQTGSSRQQPKL